ncbi:hypothetical protein MLD38_023746 [Melastoma candidum]|uniref:Uncharacterized protein n=1 Tax=Melastoma candidum TaxID=119954 RepID=A0ACB9NR29_9MYRT|nr:hypothetical protein MLD38_023746 [Melastoma candidum]
MEATVSIVPPPPHHHHHRVVCFPPASTRNHHRWGQSQLSRKSLPNALKLLPSPPPFPPSSCCLNGGRPKGSIFSSVPDSAETAPDQLAILLEVDGVLVDAYRVGNRKAFNKAFQKLGLDCANWTEPVYTDLTRKSDGDEEMMLVLYFNRIGWPSSLPTSEKSAFIKSVLEEKKNAMDEFMMSEDLPFRPGVQKFIDDACEKGIPVVMVTAYSKCGEKVARYIIERLGEKRTSKIKIVGWKEVEQSLYGRLVLGKGMLSGPDEQLSKEVRKAVSAEKQRIAEEIASLLKLRVELNTNSPESSDKIVTTLRAAAEFAEAPVRNCILIAGSLPGVRGCERVGMPCIVVRNSFTARAEIPSTSAIVMDGFGEPDLTISRLQLRKWS